MKTKTSKSASNVSGAASENIKDGKKAIAAAKKFDGKSKRDSDKDSAADAKKFRNEG